MTEVKNYTDLIWLIDRIVWATEALGEESVALPTGVARVLVDLAKTAKRPKGRQQITGREKVREKAVLAWARGRKRTLIEGGMKKGAAATQAAEEACQRLRSRNLAVSTIKRRMERQLTP